MSARHRSKYRPKQDDPRMSDPKPYDLNDQSEIDRLHSELEGYMRVSLKDGTDTEGRAFAYAALCAMNRRRRLAGPQSALSLSQQSTE
jgi:hypothetical protein